MPMPVSRNKILFWNMMGSLSVGLLSIVLLLLVARLLPNKVADTYSIAYAFGHLIFIVSLFQVRNFQATDVSEAYSFNSYFWARVVTCCLGMIVALVYGLLTANQLDKWLAIVLICLLRLTDAISDVFQGLFQQQERMDIAGKSLFYRNALVVMVFGLTLLCYRQLHLALVVTTFASALFVVCFDYRQSKSFVSLKCRYFSYRKIISLLKTCFPLFLSGFLLVFIYNQPKYTIDLYLDGGLLPVGSQTVFSIIFMPAFVMNLVIMFFRPLFTQLAIQLDHHHFEAFKALRRKLLAGMCLMCLVILLVGYVVGLPVLGLIYGVNLAPYQSTFMLLLLGGVFSSLATVFDNLLTIARKQHLLLVSYVLAFMTSLLLSNPLIERYGLYGGGILFCLSMVTWLISLWLSDLVVYRRIFSNADSI